MLIDYWKQNMLEHARTHWLSIIQYLEGNMRHEWESFEREHVVIDKKLIY